MVDGNKQITKKRIKVAHVIWWIPHYRIPVFERLSRNPYLDFWVWAGENCQVFSGTVASADQVGRKHEVNWVRISSQRLRGPLFKFYEWQPEAVRLAWREDLDAIICFGNKSLSNWMIRIICKLRGIPILEWSQGVRTEERGVKWAVRKFYFKWARAQLLYGEYARDFYLAHGFSKKEVFVVHNSLDHDAQVAVRKKLTDADKKKVREEYGVGSPNDRLIFHSGRLEKRKNLPLLIEAVKEMKNKGKKVVLVLVGDGQEKADLREYVRLQGLSDQVVFQGACYDEEILGRIFFASDLCVVPGALGLLAMHSFVYGTPILVCENKKGLHGPEIETVVEGRTGGYFREGNLTDLIDKMDAMMYPEPCKTRMAQTCMKLIDTYYTPKYQEKIIIKALNYVLSPTRQIPLEVDEETNL